MRKSKLTPAKIAEAEAWVETHGLYPQPKGASVKTFCEAMGIDENTHRKWEADNSVYSATLTRAREKFKQTIVREVADATIEAAKGFSFEKTREDAKAVDEVIEEFDPNTGKLIRRTTTKKLVTVKAVRERYVCPPDMKAAALVLTNMDPQNWRQKQDLNVGGQKDERIPIVVGSSDTAAKLREIIDNHAQPDAPAREEE